MNPIIADDSAIHKAADLLRKGRLVAFPTETVYGLGADAKNPEAVKRIFAAKGRPADHPLIVHIPDSAALEDWAVEIPDIAWKLAERFWPGSLTIVLKKHPDVPMEVTGGQNTVALRVPNHPVALNLLKAFGGGIAAPSANRYCRISPTQAGHVEEELGDKVDMILDGGACKVGLESTIVDLSGVELRLLRPGQISKGEIEEVIKAELEISDNSSIRAPGMMDVHYAPTTQTVLCSTGQLKNIYQHYLKLNQKVGIATYTGEFEEHNDNYVILMPKDAHDYGRVLYSALRNLDHSGVDIILVEKPPQTEDWRAVNDRLNKASSVFQGLKSVNLDPEVELDKVRNEVLRKIGRNVVLYQEIERMLKFLTIAGNHSGYLSELPTLLEKKADTIQKLTMGKVVGLFLGNMYSGIEEYKESAEEELKEIRLSFQFNMECEEGLFEAKKQTLSSIVADRNELIHHFLSKFNLQTIESCLEAEKYLDQQRDKILPQHKELINAVKYFRETLKEYDEFVKSDEFQKQIELVNVRQCIVVRLLEDVSKRMARADGWALVSLAGQLIKKDAPEELVLFNKKHGSKTLKKSILATGLFDLKEESTNKGGVRLLYKLKSEFDFEYSDQ
jgi:L-threonylcarbamoyladenylate synthase